MNMKFFKNKFFIITLAIAIFLVILTGTLAAMGQTGPIKSALNIVATPFRYVGGKIGEGLGGIVTYFTTIDKLQDENQVLRAEKEALARQLADKRAIEEENERLRRYLDVKKAHPGLILTEALVIGQASESQSSLLTLNRGSDDGIKVGMPVITEAGLVGSVSQVSKTTCTLRLLTEGMASAGAYDSRTGEVGLIEGDIALKGSNRCYLSYLKEDSQVEVGDLIYTSGEGSIFPRGLLIGSVKEVRTDAYLRQKQAVVETAADMNGLTYVMIVIGREKTG